MKHFCKIITLLLAIIVIVLNINPFLFAKSKTFTESLSSKCKSDIIWKKYIYNSCGFDYEQYCWIPKKALYNDILFIASNHSSINIVDLSSRKISQFIEISGYNLHPPVIENENIYLLYCDEYSENNNYVISAYNIDTKQKLWDTLTNINNAYTYTVDNSFVYLVSENKLCAYNINTGTQSWQVEVDNEIRIMPAITENVIYIVNSHCCYAVNNKNGEIIWKGKVDININKSPLYINGNLILFLSKMMVILDAETGKEVKRKAFDFIDYQPFSEPALIYNDLIIFFDSYRLYAMDYKTMKYKWTIGGNFSDNSPTPVLYNEMIYCIDQKYLYQIDPDKGKVTIKKDLYKIEPYSPIFCIDDNVYFACEIPYNRIFLFSVTTKKSEENWKKFYKNESIYSYNKVFYFSGHLYKIYDIYSEVYISCVSTEKGKLIWNKSIGKGNDIYDYIWGIGNILYGYEDSLYLKCNDKILVIDFLEGNIKKTINRKISQDIHENIFFNNDKMYYITENSIYYTDLNSLNETLFYKPPPKENLVKIFYDDNTIYVISEKINSILTALDINNGSKMFSFPCTIDKNIIFSSNSLLYINPIDFTLNSIDKKTGLSKWNKVIGYTDSIYCMFINDDIVYVASYLLDYDENFDYSVHIYIKCFNADGEVIYEFDGITDDLINNNELQFVGIRNDEFIVIFKEGIVFGLNINKKNFTWYYITNDEICDSPVILDNKIYISDESGYYYSI